MIINEDNYNGNTKFCHHYSDNNKYIIQVETKKEYLEAVDLKPCKYTYIESEREIEKPIDLEEDKNIIQN